VGFIWDLEIGIWDFKRYALCALRFAEELMAETRRVIGVKLG
jgi:hypothetical protein